MDEISKSVLARAAELMPEDPRDVPLDDQFVLDCLRANERGDAVLYATLHRGRYLYNLTPKDGEWYRWAGHIWEQDEAKRVYKDVEQVALCYQDQLDRLEAEGLDWEDKKSPMVSLAKDLRRRINRLRSVQGMKNTVFLAPVIDESMSCKETNMNRHPMLLPCANGVINLKSGLLFPGRQEDLMSMAIPVEYDPGADYSQWCDFVVDTCGSKELAAFVQRSIGYAVTGHSHEQYIWVFIGRGRNGKGVLFSCISKILGPFCHTLSSAMIMEQRFDPPPSAASEHKMSLLGKRLTIASETKQGKRIDAPAVKTLTGDDTINARPNFGREVNFDPTHTLMLLTNHMPVGITADNALVQRLLKIDFPWAFVDDPKAEARKNPVLADRFRKKDPDLKEKLMQNPQGILRWIVEGCLLWQKHGIDPPPEVRASVDELARQADYIGEFLEDCVVRLADQPDQRVACTVMYTAFKWWWGKNMDEGERRIPALKTMTAALRERGWRVEKKGGQYWVYETMIEQNIADEVFNKATTY